MNTTLAAWGPGVPLLVIRRHYSLSYCTRPWQMRQLGARAASAGQNEVRLSPSEVRRGRFDSKIPVERLPIAAVAEAHVVVDVDPVAEDAHRAVAQQAIKATGVSAAEDEDSVVAAIDPRRKSDLIV